MSKYKDVIESIKNELDILEKNITFFEAEGQTELVRDVERNLDSLKNAVSDEVKVSGDYVAKMS